MARLARLTVPGYPHHLIQRGNNKQPIFVIAADYLLLLELLHENAKKFSVSLHAYVLMGNHFHLLATPATTDGLSQMMQSVGRRYVRYFNDSQARSGTLWEGRYRSTLIDTDRYLLACMAYIDLNPVRAGLLKDPAIYPWSSHGHYIGLRNDAMVTPHPLFWTLGNTPFAREVAYAQRVANGISTNEEHELTGSVLGGWALGSEEFVVNLQKQTPRRVKKNQPGRPVRFSREE